MKIIVKYRTEKSFKDKYTKEEITANTMIDVSVERMKELNAVKAGRAEDIIVVLDELEETEGNNNNVIGDVTTYTKEQLEKMNVNGLKELAEKENIELTKAKKEEIIVEILEKLK